MPWHIYPGSARCSRMLTVIGIGSVGRHFSQLVAYRHDDLVEKGGGIGTCTYFN